MSHFDGKRFHNPDGSEPRGLLDVLRWKFTSRPEPSPTFVSDVRPSVPPRNNENGLLVTLVNHSTVLLQQNGLNILTDPIWSDRASPFGWIGPKRHRAPGVRWEDLPPIHVVLLSHNHYDHLDLPTLRRLRDGHRPAFVVPLGVRRLLVREGMEEVHELDWGGSVEVRGLRVDCVPAVHFSARGMGDRNRTLWCGYVVESCAGRVYFAGDTAAGPHFAAIRERFGRPRLALLPIGAFRPRWFMRSVHMDPGDAMEAHRTLGAETSMAIHHGTFQMADDALDVAAEEMRKLLEEARGEAGRWALLRNGKRLEVKARRGG